MKETALEETFPYKTGSSEHAEIQVAESTAKKNRFTKKNMQKSLPCPQ